MARDFDGSADYISVASDPAIEGFSNLCLCAWIYPTADGASAGGRIVSKQQGSGGDDYNINHGNTSMWFRINTDSGQTTLQSGSTFTHSTAWLHLAATWDGDNMEIFFDGVSDATGNQTGTLDDSNSPLGIGGHIASSSRRFQGYIAYCVIDGTVPSDERINSMANGIHPFVYKSSNVPAIYELFGNDSPEENTVSDDLSGTLVSAPPKHNGGPHIELIENYL